jgi:hypothetical protein
MPLKLGCWREAVGKGPFWCLLNLSLTLVMPRPLFNGSKEVTADSTSLIKKGLEFYTLLHSPLLPAYIPSFSLNVV